MRWGTHFAARLKANYATFKSISDIAPYEKPKDLPHFEEWEALEELVRITSEDGGSEPIDF